MESAPDIDPADLERLAGSARRDGLDEAAATRRRSTFLRFESAGAAMEAEFAIDPVAGAERALRAAAPDLAAELHEDVDNRAVLACWGSSAAIEIDEDGTRNETVAPAVVTLIAKALGTDPDPWRCHAGLLHTYGYLLSRAATKYGRKRHRWSSHDVGALLAMADPWPLEAGAGILTEVTAALLAVAPIDNPHSAGVPTCRNGRPHQLVLVGEVVVAHDAPDGPSWVSRTRFLTPAIPDGGDDHLLVYSVRINAGAEQYITAFPVSGEIADRTLGAEPEVRLRYNAVA